MDYIKKNQKWKFVIIILIAFVAIPVFVNALFQIKVPFKILQLKWGVNDALSYFGSIVGGLGTIFLGIITIQQTNWNNKKIEETDKANTKRPFFVIDKVFAVEYNDGRKLRKEWEYGKNSFEGRFSKNQSVYIDIKNIGDGVANNLVIEPYGFGNIRRDDRPSACVAAGENYTVQKSLKKSIFKETTTIYVFYENIIGYAYYQIIELSVEDDTIVNSDTSYEIEQYQTKIYNIYPQVALGMDCYDWKTGKYKFDKSKRK